MDIHSNTRKLKPEFREHVKRKELSRLTTELIVKFDDHLSEAEIETMKWITAVKEDVDATGLIQKDITAMNNFAIESARVFRVVRPRTTSRHYVNSEQTFSVTLLV